MKVALFTHNFLEPTHHAIAAVLSELREIRFHVYAKRLDDRRYFQIPNIVGRTYYTKGELPELANYEFNLVQAIYDGKTAIRAAMLAYEHRVPFLLSFHGGFDTNAKIFDRRYTESTRKIAEFAVDVTVVSAADVSRLHQIGVRRPVRVVPVPVNPGQIPQDDVEEDPFMLVTVGRLIPKKGLDIALQALQRLPPRYRLYIVGDGEMKGELLLLAEKLALGNRVQFTGYLPLPSTLKLLKRAGALLHPARVAADGNADGTPQIILWAQLLRVPVISTTTGSISEIVSGETGILVRPNDPGALARAVRSVSDRQFRGLLTENAFQYVNQYHSLSHVTSVWRSVYHDACNEKSEAVVEPARSSNRSQG